MDADSFVLLSWISEYAYCKRRFYLRIFEQNNAENGSLVEGRLAHKRVDQSMIEKRGESIKVTRMMVHSDRCQMHGLCDSIEFTKDPEGAYVDFLDGNYRICPVEYKHGRSRDEIEYKLQLTAQALCLEEMYHTKISEGYIYYIGQKDRRKVSFDSALRQQVTTAVTEIRDYLMHPMAIQPEYRKRCPHCSLYEICSPKNVIAKRYLERVWDKYVYTE